jgi:signal transduction histidine kinase
MADSLQRSEQRRNDFIANVSHELKTPMTTISGFADGLLDGTIPREQQDKYLVIIADETRRLSRLVRSMLDLSRMEGAGSDLARRREFDISEVVLSTLLSFEARDSDKRLDVDLQVPENHINVLGDPDAITRVVYNLMDNAIKFAYPGSTLGVSLWKNDGKAYVSVRDTGETIPSADLPYIFDRFHKSDRSRSLDRDGVGLGLYLVKRILDAHGEDIAVTSRDGVTDFVFTLTLAGEKR